MLKKHWFLLLFLNSGSEIVEKALVFIAFCSLGAGKPYFCSGFGALDQENVVFLTLFEVFCSRNPPEEPEEPGIAGRKAFYGVPGQVEVNTP